MEEQIRFRLLGFPYLITINGFESIIMFGGIREAPVVVVLALLLVFRLERKVH